MTRVAAVLAAALALALIAPQGFAQDKPVELRFSHWVPTSHPMHTSAEEWAASIKAASHGSIDIKIFPAQQLGKAFDHYNMARDGIVDIAHVNPGYEPGRFPVMGAVELPLMFANAKEGSAAGDAWYRTYAQKEMGDVHYCLNFFHDPGTFHAAHKKILAPEDISGLKVRPANATNARWVTLLGGTNVQASAPEARNVLEKGVADAIAFPWGSVVLFGIDKVTKYHLDAQLYVTEQTWVLNKATYAALSAAQKKVIDDHCTSEWAQKIAAPWADFEAAGRIKIKAMPGHEVSALTADQLALWRKSAAPLEAEWAESVRKAGYDPDALMGELKSTIARYKASY
jgi:TRAP-type C4-dicarboxylate transport system substrate-binding protein